MQNARMISVLTIVGFVSGGALLLTHGYANPLVKDNQKKETTEAVYKIFPKGKNCRETPAENETVFEVKDGGGNILGYAFLAEGSGYQGAIKMMAGVEPDLETLVGIEILESQETGLGQEITQDKFKAQFKGLKALPEIACVKNAKPAKPNEIQAITGATVSSSAVVSVLNEKIRNIRRGLSKPR